MDSQLLCPNREADIWARLIQTPGDDLSRETAEYLLSMRLGDSDLNRLHQLAEGSEAGTLTGAELAEFDSYLHIGNLLAVMQSKARRVLGRPHS